MKKLALLLLGTVLLSGCFRSGDDPYLSYSTGGEYYSYDYVMEEMAMPEGSGMLTDTRMADDGYVEGAEQLLIKTGSLSLHVEDVRTAVEDVKVAVEGMGGDLSYSNIYLSGNAYYGSLTVRVPAERFDEAMTALKDLSVIVNSESTNVDNVTKAVMDLEARLLTLEEEEQQYLAILDRATTVEEILNVTDYLSSVRYEIESTQASLDYYGSQIAYSTISLTLTEDSSVATVKESWRPISTIRDAFSGWVVFLQDLVDLGIYLLIFGWPFVLLGLGLWRWLGRRGGKRK